MRKLLVCFTIVLLLVLVASVAVLPGALERINASGVLNVGAREGATGFAYYDEQGDWVGFSMDIAKAVHEKFEQVLEKDLRLNFVPVTAKTRIPAVAAGTVDVVIGIAGWSRAREEVVDFAIPHFYVAIRTITKIDTPIEDLEDLAGMRVGTATGTTDEITLMELSETLPEPIKLITYEKHTDGFLALQQGKLDAYLTDDSLLASMRVNAKNPADWKIVGRPLNEVFLCSIVAEDDSDLRDLVSFAIMELLETGRYWEIYDKWFGPNGVIPYEMAKEGKTYLNSYALMRG